MTKEINKNKIEHIAELVARHYILLHHEDNIARKIAGIFREGRILLQNSKKEIKYNHLERKLLYTVYPEHIVESVRLGVYKTLFFEVYKIVHGELDFLSLTTHGLVRERLDIYKINYKKSNEKRICPDKPLHLHTGIDLAIIFVYPSKKNGRKKIAVPLFIIGKYKEESIKKIKLFEAIKTVLLERPLKNKKIKIALEHIPKFTIISLLKTMIYKNKEKLKQNEICKEKYQGIPIYDDLAQSIVCPINKKIPGFYSTVDNDEKLVNLSSSDWVTALIHLAVPIIIIASSDSPPSTSDGGLTFKMLKEIYNKVDEKLNKLNKIPELNIVIKDREDELKQKREEIKHGSNYLLKA